MRRPPDLDKYVSKATVVEFLQEILRTFKEVDSDATLYKVRVSIHKSYPRDYKGSEVKP